MSIVANLVEQTTTSTGTGNLTLAAVDARQTCASAIGTGSSNTFAYFIMHETADEWERGTGYMFDSTTLVRSTVHESSNADAAVDFSAGTKRVTNAMPADELIAKIRPVADRTALKALNTSVYTTAYLKEDGREGVFEWVGSDLSTEVAADTSEGVYVSSGDGSSGAWVRADSGDLNVRWFGAVADAISGSSGTDSTTAFQAALDLAVDLRRSVYIPGGAYRITSALTVDLTANTGVTEPRITIEGDGRGSTIIYFGSGAYAGLTIAGGTSSGVHLHAHVSGLYLRKADTLGTGLKVTDGAYFHLEDVHCSGWEYATDFDDCLSFEVEACVFRFNDYGMRARQTGGSKPNAIAIISCVFGNNNENGLTLDGVGNLTMIGGSIEVNGASGTDGTKGGLYLVNGPTQAGVGMLLSGVYIEGNVGDADILYASSAGAPTAITFVGCSFQRVSSTNYSTNNVSASGSDVMNISFHGCAFKSLGTYTADAGRPYVDISGAANATVSMDSSNYQEDAAETWYTDGAETFHAHSAVAASVGATTAETTLATISIPANSLGPNGYIEIITDVTVNSNANTKRLRVKYGGTTFATHSFTTSTQGRFFTDIANRNSASSQVGGSAASTAFTSFGFTSAGIQTGSVDTTSAHNIVITGEKPADSADTFTLERYRIRVVRGN